MTLDAKDILFLKVFRPVGRCACDLHLLRAHGDHHSDLQRRGLHNVFQATRGFQTSKQQRCSIRRLVNDSSIQRPRFYGPKAVVVLVCDIIQSSPPVLISISVSDILLSLCSPLESSSRSVSSKLPRSHSAPWLAALLRNSSHRASATDLADELA